MTRRSDLVSAIKAMCETTSVRGERLRIGLDIVSVDWFARQLANGESSFICSAFTPDERAYCSGRPERFAVRWAAKEAVAKAIGTGFRGLRPRDIEIIHLPDGRPEIMAAFDSTWPNHAHTWNWALTLCHEGDAAVAVAVGAPPDQFPLDPGINPPPFQLKE